MPLRSRKRGRAGADDHVKNGGRPKMVCATAGSAGGGEAAAATAASTSPEDYSSMECWDKRYREGMFVEWYCGFDHVRPLFERFVPKDSSVLDVGCGDKPLAWDLRDAGYTGKICSFDFSPTVIEQHLAEKEKLDRTRLDTGVEFRVLDARNLPFEGGTFDLVVDKGTVDAMLCDEAGKGSARATCREAARVVASGGWFVIVSHIHPNTVEGVALLSEAMVPGLQDSASSAGGEEFFWSVDIHCGSGGGSDGDSDGSDSGDGGSGSGGGGSGEGRGGEAAEEEGEGGGGNGDSLGPSAYMARKVAKRTTRSSSRGQRQPRAIPIRIHEY
ncbi:unnamed protein product [Laminaria digitata]